MAGKPFEGIKAGDLTEKHWEKIFGDPMREYVSGKKKAPSAPDNLKKQQPDKSLIDKIGEKIGQGLRQSIIKNTGIDPKGVADTAREYKDAYKKKHAELEKKDKIRAADYFAGQGSTTKTNIGKSGKGSVQPFRISGDSIVQAINISNQNIVAGLNSILGVNQETLTHQKGMAGEITNLSTVVGNLGEKTDKTNILLSDIYDVLDESQFIKHEKIVPNNNTNYGMGGSGGGKEKSIKAESESIVGSLIDSIQSGIARAAGGLATKLAPILSGVFVTAMTAAVPLLIGGLAGILGYVIGKGIVNWWNKPSQPGPRFSPGVPGSGSKFGQHRQPDDPQITNRFMPTIPKDLTREPPITPLPPNYQGGPTMGVPMSPDADMPGGGGTPKTGIAPSPRTGRFGSAPQGSGTRGAPIISPTSDNGSRSWRNNNPGNLKYGDFAKEAGAVGQDEKGFAIFPTFEEGQKAREKLLFEDERYKDQTVRGAISKYAPSSENDTEKYIKEALKDTGVDENAKLSSFTPEQRKKFLENMQQHEGYIPGKQKALGTTDGPKIERSKIENEGLVPSNYEDIKGKANQAKSGGPWGEPGENITTIKLDSGKTVNVNKHSAEAFKGFLNELEASGYDISSLGGHAKRMKTSGGSISQHAFGNAIDINPQQNPYSHKLITNLPSNISQMAAKYGLSWGGDWKSIKDAMHFEYTGIKPVFNKESNRLSEVNKPNVTPQGPPIPLENRTLRNYVTGDFEERKTSPIINDPITQDKILGPQEKSKSIMETTPSQKGIELSSESIKKEVDATKTSPPITINNSSQQNPNPPPEKGPSPGDNKPIKAEVEKTQSFSEYYYA